MKTWLGVAVVLLATACGGGDGGGNVDPRCNSLCTIDEPEVEGAFDICSDRSAQQCKQECTVRIADANSLCASCLLEQACFAPACGASGDGPACDANGQCTVTGREGSCMYPAGDDAARDNCLRQVEPRRSVECTPEYRSVEECSAVCVDALPDAGN